MLTFTNALSVYLSGDTGMTAEQESVICKYYKPQLAVINIGGTFTTGPTEAAYVISDLVKPNSVIASHANEQATTAVKLLPGTRSSQFIDQLDMTVFLLLSGVTMEFDNSGMCINGCK